MSHRIHLLTIDAQNDFCDPKGALFVKGADEDVKRLANLVNRLGRKIDNITATLDSHHNLHIAHPIMWTNTKGEHPSPFTIITADDIKNGVWQATMPQLRKWQREYVETLAKNNRYPLCIWPPHCLIGSWGHSFAPEFHAALSKWEMENTRMVIKVTKGSNLKTEHYSAVCADVPDPEDPHTQLNVGLIDSLKLADDILITGEALSHCVANTVRDIAKNFDPDYVKKFVLLEDTCSNVGGFDQFGIDFVKDMLALGMRKTTSVDYLA